MNQQNNQESEQDLLSEYSLTEDQRDELIIKSPLNVILEYHHLTSRSFPVQVPKVK